MLSSFVLAEVRQYLRRRVRLTLELANLMVQCCQLLLLLMFLLHSD